MERRVELHNKMAELLNSQCDHLAITTRIVNPNRDDYALDWVKEGTKQHYFLCNSQITLYPTDVWINDLNEKGLELYSSALIRVQKEDFKAEYDVYYFDTRNSGSWFADEESVWRNETPPHVEKGCKGTFNSWNNLTVSGVLKDEKGSSLFTSPCVFIGLEKDEKGKCVGGWCLTKSGSLYKLGVEREREYVDEKIREFKKKLDSESNNK